jgi:hypothetical protein
MQRPLNGDFCFGGLGDGGDGHKDHEFYYIENKENLCNCYFDSL